MDWPVVVTQWLHVFFGSFWFGGTLYANFVVMPGILSLPKDRQVPVINALTASIDRVIPWVAAATIVLGFLRGTLFGPITGLADLGAGYGLYWVLSLTVAVATFAWGWLVIRPLGQRLTRESARLVGAAGEVPSELLAIGNRLKLVALIETIGFLIIFTLMILMHAAGEG